jgi:hypothetical protein
VALSQLVVGASADAAFACLSDPTTYPHWLTGTRRIFSIDAGFPAPDTSFRHEVGFGLLRVRDVTTSSSCDAPGRHLVLQVHARPLLGTARAAFTVAAIGADDAWVTIEEDQCTIPLRGIVGPLTDQLIQARNDRSLRRLRAFLATAGGSRTDQAVEGAAGRISM